MTKFEEAKSLLTQLGYEELSKIREETYTQQKLKFADHQKESTLKYQMNRARREASKKREELEDYPKLLQFATILKRGDIIKFKGTRGLPYREFVEMRGQSIVGMQIQYGGKSKTWTKTGYSSENHYSNISGYRTSVGVWIDRKEILKGYKI